MTRIREGAVSEPTDSEMLDWLEAFVLKHGGILLHDGTKDWHGAGLGLRPGRLVRSLRQAVATAMQRSAPTDTQDTSTNAIQEDAG